MNALERMAKTEALFRDVNERIAETAQRFESEEAELVCECPDRECTDRVEVPLSEYERVRSDATHFVMAPGHEEPRIERVIRPRRGYAVVEKFNRIVVATVRRLNPRAKSG